MKPVAVPIERIENRILLVRGHKVLLDTDLAMFYGVPTKRFNEQVRRNAERFPRDFMFQLSPEEWDSLRSQFATLKTGRGQHRKYLPHAFTELGGAIQTFKYRPQFPACFAGLEHARAHSREFFPWYNNKHRHSGIGFMTPAAVHFGTAPALWQQRAAVLQAVYLAHPERFKSKHPTPPKLPTVVGINLPKPQPPEPSHDLIQTPALLTNLQTQVSHSH